MTPTLIVCLPLQVALPQFRLFQHVRFTEEIDAEVLTSVGLVVGWNYISREVIRSNPKTGFYPYWQYAIQLDQDQSSGRVGDVQWVNEFDVLEIVG